jgi:hypothetical protein
MPGNLSALIGSLGVVALVVALSSPTSQGQSWSAASEHPVSDIVYSLSALEHHGETWVMAGTAGGVEYTRDGGATWTTETLNTIVFDIQAVGDSMFVLAAGSRGLFRLGPGDDRLVALGFGGHLRVHAVTEVSDGSLVSGGSNGVSRSSDSGASWTDVNPIFTTTCCVGPMVIAGVGEGRTVAWAAVGAPETNNLSLSYSADSGRTWSDSSAAPVGLALFPAVSHTPRHVELVFAGFEYHARATWNDPRVRHETTFEVSGSVYTTSWGLLVSSFSGLFRLDEESLEWTNLFEASPLYALATLPSGRVFVAKPRSVIELVPNITGVEPVASRQMLEIYPNPSIGRVMIRGARPGSQYAVVDILGRTVHRFRGRATQSLDTRSLPPGLYVLIRDSVSTDGTFLVTN